MQAAEETGFIRKNEAGELVGTGEGALGYLKWAAIHRAERFLGMFARVIPSQTPPRTSTRIGRP
jgi:hypothetical protein